MPNQIYLALRGLFPPGSLPEEDTKVDSIIDICAKEFGRIETKSVAVTSAPPGSDLFGRRWKAIGFGTQNTKSMEVTDFGIYCVSNNVGHLNSLVQGAKVTTSVNILLVSGLKNTKTLARSGVLRAGQMLSKIVRDEKAVSIFEMTKHAHAQAIYEVLDV